MQTTLLGLAFALILALLAALIGPFLVDWTQFRSVFEAEASRMVGLPVRVKGAIDARLLPSPSLTLHGIEIGGPDAERVVRARLLNVEFALGSLVRGELRAVEAQLAGPDVTVTLDENGAFDLPKLSVGFVPDTLTIERLTIEDGRAHLVNAATGSRTTFDKVWFNGDLRSLAGPFRGEGAFVTAGELYGYRISAGRLGEDGKLRLRLSLDPSDRPLTAEAEGALILGPDKPRFEGTIAVSRPAGLVVATGQSDLKLPWRATSRVNIDASGAKLERIDFLYGAEDGGLHLTGTADLRLGPEPLLKAVLSARQLDLDRLIATQDKPLRLPADALKGLLSSYAAAIELPIPTELSVSADTVILGGSAIHLFGADVRSSSDAWMLDRVEFRGPGLTQVNLSGRLALRPALRFSGPVKVETKEPGAFAAWLHGRSDPATRVRPFKARGQVEISQTQIAIEHFKAEVERKAVEGSLRYVAATPEQPSRLDAELSAPEIDLDPLVEFAKVALSGSALPLPSEVAVNVAVGRAWIAGIEAKTVRAQLKRDANALLVERLSIADLRGARLTASGRIDTSGAAPRGRLALEIEARDLGGIIAVAEKYAPAAADRLRRAAARVPEAKLRVTLNLDGPDQPTAGAKTDVRLVVEGRVGGLRASFRGRAQQDSAKTIAAGLPALLGSDIRLEAQMDGDDGRTLVALLGLDRALSVAQGPGFVNLIVTGTLGDPLRVDGRIVAGGLDGKASGTMHLGFGQAPSADLQLEIANADIRPLAGITERMATLPLALHSRVALSERSVKFSDLKGTLAGTELRGALMFGFAARPSVAGQIEADSLDAAALVATVIGAPSARASGRSSGWSTEPYGAGRIPNLEGKVDLKVMRATLTPSLPARQLETTVAFDGSAITLDDFRAHVAGGRLAGRLAFRRGEDGLAVRTRIDLAAIDAAAVLPSDPRPAIGGRLSASLNLEASGLSPKALIGSLAGTGTVRLEDGYFSSLNPQVFETIIRASDQGLATGTARIGEIVSAALESGRLQIPRIETTLTLDAGQMRLGNAVAAIDGAELAVAGSLDLIQNRMDVRLTLTGRSDGASGGPDIFVGLNGPVAKPQRSIDVSALAGWLTIRRIEQQARKLEALEAAAEQEAARRRTPIQVAPTLPAAAVAPVEPPAIAASIPMPPKRKPAAAIGQPTLPTPVVMKPPHIEPPAVSPAKPAPLTSLRSKPLVTPSASASLPVVTPPIVYPTPTPTAPYFSVPRIAVPEPGSSRSPPVPSAGGAAQQEVTSESEPVLAPPLPAPREIRRIPRGPGPTQSSAIERRPSDPLLLPSSQPPMFDPLIGPQR